MTYDQHTDRTRDSGATRTHSGSRTQTAPTHGGPVSSTRDSLTTRCGIESTYTESRGSSSRHGDVEARDNTPTGTSSSTDGSNGTDSSYLRTVCRDSKDRRSNYSGRYSCYQNTKSTARKVSRVLSKFANTYFFVMTLIAITLFTLGR